MSSTIDDFRDKCKTLDFLIEKHCIDLSGKSEPIYDGITDIETYYEEKIKILWVLKEPYDEDDCSGGGWKLFEDIDRNYIRIGKNRTLRTIIYTSYGLLNKFKKYENIDDINNYPEISFIIKRIAYINVKKLPGLHNTSWDKLFIAYKENRDILLRQIEVYNPNVIIFGNTFHLFKEDIDISRYDKISENAITVFTSKDRILIDAYHPAQRQITRDIYVNGIIRAVENWVKVENMDI